MRVTAIIPAAGLGVRLRSAIPKPLIHLGRKPILFFILETLSRNSWIQQIIIAVRKDTRQEFAQALKKFKSKIKIEIVLGADTRKHSVENCLEKIAPDADTVLIHDGARPLVSEELVGRLLQEAKRNPAVICGVPVKATVKRVSGLTGKRVSGFVEKTIKREGLWEIQTPQVFKKEVLVQAYKNFRGSLVTDDASLVEKLGIKVKVVLGSYYNIKITTPEDLAFIKAILKSGYG